MKKIAALIALTLYIGFVAYYQVYQREKGENLRGYDQKFFFDIKKLEGIKISSQTHDISLTKRKGTWWVTEPMEYLADQEFLQKSIRIMDQVIVENLFRKSSQDYYGFDPGQALIQFIHSDGEVKRFIVGEKEAPQNKIYLLNMDTDEVLVVHNVWGQLIYFPKSMFFSKSLPFEGEQIKEVSLSEGQRTLWRIQSKTAKRVELTMGEKTIKAKKTQLLWFFKKMGELNLKDFEVLDESDELHGKTLSVTTEKGSMDFIFSQEDAQVFIPKKKVRAGYDPVDFEALLTELNKVVDHGQK